MQRIASLTTSDAVIRRESVRPGGLRRDGAVCRVAAPRRCYPPHRLRRRALHPAPSRSQRGLRGYWDRLFVFASASLGQTPPAGPELFPFVAPWDDDSGGVTSRSGWLERPAGARGFVTVRDGHLFAGDARVRFFGVNFCFGGCFPRHEDAERIASRMAKFGINCVRFHHMDTSESPNGLLEKDALTLEAVQLDKLDYFIAQLKKNGIYADLNLHVGRVYPGMPKWEGMPGYFKGVDNFCAKMIDLQRDYARDLLAHVNPYTKSRYADEPAVAIVEINNENGLIHEWLAGSLDGMPEPYAGELAGQWNAFLRRKYPDPAALRRSWAKSEQPLGGEMLKNADFSGGLEGWSLEQVAPAAGSAEKTNDAPGGRSAVRIRVRTTSETGWHVQLIQSGLALEAGRTYTLRFLARADAPRTVSVHAMQAHQPWRGFWGSEVRLSTEWRPFRFLFTPKEGDENSRIGFTGLALARGTCEFAEVSLRPGGVLALEPGEELGRVGVFLKQDFGRRTPEAQRDWLRFLLDTEHNYWTGMSRFLKEELKSKSLVVGTIAGCSPAGVQAELDLVDAHAYWQHPRFPGRPWDPSNWFVNNVSMVNSPGGVLAGLAGHRVAERPFLVTEYNHPAPNTYSSEAPLLLAALAGLQDWDGVFLFTYSHRRDDWDARQIRNFFDIDQHPPKMVNLPVAAALFERGDVKPAQRCVTAACPPEKEVELLERSGAPWRLVHLGLLDVPGWTSLIHRTAIRLGEQAPAADSVGAPKGEAPSRFVSDTGELTWDLSRKEKGVVTVDSARTKCVVGFIDGRAFTLGGVTITPGKTLQDWCTVAITLKEGESFTGPARALLVATGYVENTNMGWKNAEKSTVGREWGKAPTLVEGIPATITLPVPARRVKLWALDERGQRGKELPVNEAAGKAEFRIGGEHRTLWYELELGR